MAKTIVLEKRNLQPVLLLVKNGHLSSIPVEKTMTIGRATQENKVDIDLDARFVSRRHGMIGCDGYGCYYMDTSSKYGTYYNGKKIPAGQKQYLSDGDVLHIYNNHVESSKDFTAIVYMADYPDKFTESRIAVDDTTAEIHIGRSGNKDVLLEDAAVSSNHASIFTTREGWAVVDHNSMNGVFLNNQKITAPRYIKIGDCIRIAKEYFVFLGNAVVYQRTGEQQIREVPLKKEKNFPNVPLSIHIAERSVRQRTKKITLLQNIDMIIDSGEMVLILGGSGAGKTTFMNAVMGYEKADGKIMYGDTDIYEEFEQMKYKIGFVPQQDLLRGSDTVYDTLENAAEMKLPSSMKWEEKAERIEKVLETLGLKREKDSLVSKLSGGQRKRLSIAVEYIADPGLFFLDEPDSGLDGIMSKTLMQNLRTIANEGKIVIVISHGPDRAAELFDKVIVLAKSVRDNCGHLAFFGTVNEAYQFFDVNSLEGVVKRINREDEGGDGQSDYYIRKNMGDCYG